MTFDSFLNPDFLKRTTGHFYFPVYSYPLVDYPLYPTFLYPDYPSVLISAAAEFGEVLFSSISSLLFVVVMCLLLLPARLDLWTDQWLYFVCPELDHGPIVQSS